MIKKLLILTACLIVMPAWSDQNYHDEIMRNVIVPCYAAEKIFISDYPDVAEAIIGIVTKAVKNKTLEQRQSIYDSNLSECIAGIAEAKKLSEELW